MTDEHSARPDIEHIAAFARGELDDQKMCKFIESDKEAMDLVRQIQTDDEFLTRLAGAWSEAPDGSGRAAPPPADMVPGYRILGELHRGGQGTVYRAIQERTKRTVALKVMHGGASAPAKSRARFAREVELIASMRHPNIVTVFDGGDLPDGGCFVAMEFIRGVPLVRADAIDRQMDDHTRAGLVRLKLDQIARICDAVQYAHLRGIIHRDLKPGNILIDRNGEPKVLDFGVAKVLGSQDAADMTLTGEFVGTFAYAAPEQVSGSSDDIDTRCDIYALGVVMYEMLTGRFPYDISGPMSQTIKNISETDPVPASRVAEGLDNEIDAIVATAMAKSSDRRYQSAGSLAADVRRYLAGEPIEARRDSTGYLLAKLAKRHRGPITLACVLVLALVGLSIWMSLLYVRAAKAEKEAEAGLNAALVEADKRASVIEVFTDMIEANRPERGESIAGREPTIREMLDLAASTVEHRAIGRPDIVAAIQLAIGRSYLSLGLPEEARQQAEGAQEIARQLDSSSQQIADSEELLGWLANLNKNYDEAIERFTKVLQIRESANPADPVLVAKALLAIAGVEYSLKHFERSLALVDEGLAVLGEAGVNDLSLTVKLLNHKTRLFFFWPRDSALESKRDMDNAQQIALTAQELCEDQGMDVPDLITPLNNLAMIAKSRAELELAEEQMREALRLCQRFYPSNHLRIAGMHRNLGLVRQDRGNHVMAEQDFEQAVKIYRTHPGPTPRTYLARSLVPLGVSRIEVGDYPAARDSARESIVILRELNPGNNLRLGLALALEGAALVELGDFQAAIAPLLEAYDALVTAELDGQSQKVARDPKLKCMRDLVRAYEGLSMPEEAGSWRGRLDVARKKAGNANRLDEPSQ
ncbi:MAG: serine/threonine-protein kinase [Phycisphaerales bacterium]|nr:serine/threonine-protein kinase [Phycisphaerales bacterium]